MTISKLVQSSGIDTLDAQLLLAHVLNKSREFVIAHADERISKHQITWYNHLVQRRKHGISVAVIIGSKEFFGLTFAVNEHTLVPRPETELMVELAGGLLLAHSSPQLYVDVGTGSGCIAIAIKKQDTNGKIETIATDVSKEALTVARENAKTHHAHIDFREGSLLEPVINELQVASSKQQETVITANLPYLTQKQFDEEPSIQQEPHSALVAKDDGLELYKKLLDQIHTIFYQSKTTVLMEIDPSQADKLSSFCQQRFPKAMVIVHNDLSSQDRIVQITLIPS